MMLEWFMVLYGGKSAWDATHKFGLRQLSDDYRYQYAWFCANEFLGAYKEGAD